MTNSHIQLERPLIREFIPFEIIIILFKPFFNFYNRINNIIYTVNVKNLSSSQYLSGFRAKSNIVRCRMGCNKILTNEWKMDDETSYTLNNFSLYIDVDYLFRL